MKKGKLFWAAVAVGILIGVLSQGCGAKRVTTASSVGLEEASLERIGVLPFFIGRHPTNLQETMNCSLCRLSFDPANVAPGADSTLTRYVQEAIENRYEGLVISRVDVMQTYAAIPKDEDVDTPVSLGKKVGEILGADHMILGTVWKYRERIGGPGGAARPAAVAFDVYLIDVPKARLLWTASFDETQRSLFENVLDAKAFFSRGAKWLSVNELGKYGVKEVINQLPL